MKAEAIDTEKFWRTYSEVHFWRLNDKDNVVRDAVYYGLIYDGLLPADKAARIVDLGCGGGHFLAFLKAEGYGDILGVDSCEALARFVRESLKIPAVRADAVDFLEAAGKPLDMIAANDFLEHLPKERIVRFLLLCAANLAPGGRLLVKVPNMCSPFGLRHRYVDFTHETGFTEDSLYAALSAAGFSRIEIRSDFPCQEEPECYGRLRELYKFMGERAPRVLSKNIVALAGL